MKWVGWVFAGCLLVLFIVALHSGKKRLEKERTDMEAKVKAEADVVETQFRRAREGIPALRERLIAETGKTADLEAQKKKLAARKAELKARLEELAKSTDSLRRAKGDLAGKQEENLDEIRDLQGQLANLEKKKALLEQALGMVMEKKKF